MEEQANYIKRIEIHRLWDRFDIAWDLRPDVNILSGINGVGKTTILNRSVHYLEELSGEIKNQSNVPFDVDYITWKIVDKKVAKRTAVQEQIILPLRAQNYATLVPGKKSERTVFTMAKFTIPDDKCLVVELNEKNGGRHQSFVIENEDLVRANTINELQVR